LRAASFFLSKVPTWSTASSLFPTPLERRRHQVPVRVERGRDRGVSHSGLDRLRVHPRGDEQARVRVPQVVDADRGQFGERQVPGEAQDLALHLAEINRCTRAARPRPEQVRVHA